MSLNNFFCVKYSPENILKYILFQVCSQYCIALSRFVWRDINQKQKKEQLFSEMNVSEKYDGLIIYEHCKIAKLLNILFFAKMQQHKDCGWLSQRWTHVCFGPLQHIFVSFCIIYESKKTAACKSEQKLKKSIWNFTMVHKYHCNVAKGSKFVTIRCICNLHLREGIKKGF